MGYSVFNTGFGQEPSYPMDIFMFISLEKNHSIYLWMFEQDLYAIVSVIKWLRAAGMPAMRRGILYIPPKGVRGNLWHIPVQSPNSKAVSSCWTWQDLKVNYKVGGSMGVFCFDCAIVHKGQLVFLLIFFFPLCLCFFCLFFNVRNLGFACPWKTLWLGWNNNNTRVKAEKSNGKDLVVDMVVLG